jgi:serine/threonine protein phosphatase PrpC
MKSGSRESKSRFFAVFDGMGGMAFPNRPLIPP